MSTKKVMKLIDPSTGLMECPVCGHRHLASLRSGFYYRSGNPHYYRGSWQCPNGCSPLLPFEQSRSFMRTIGITGITEQELSEKYFRWWNEHMSLCMSMGIPLRPDIVYKNYR